MESLTSYNNNQFNSLSIDKQRHKLYLGSKELKPIKTVEGVVWITRDKEGNWCVIPYSSIVWNQVIAITSKAERSNNIELGPPEIGRPRHNRLFDMEEAD